MTSYRQSPARPRQGRRTPRYPRKLTAAVGFALALAGCGGAAPSFADEGFPPPVPAEPEPTPESPTSGAAPAEPRAATEADAGAGEDRVADGGAVDTGADEQAPAVIAP